MPRAIQFTCKQCGRVFTAREQDCKILFLDFPDGNGGLTGNKGIWSSCPRCGKKCCEIDD